MGTASEQFRTHVGLKGSPDPSLGLENAKGKTGGKPVETEDVLEDTKPERTSVVKTTPAKKKAKAQSKRDATKKATTKKKAAAKKKSTAPNKPAGVKKA